MTTRLSGLLAIWVALVLAPVAHAQPAGTVGEDFLHRVQAGDTLIDLATRYTLNSDNWPSLQRLNQVADPLQLVIGSLLRIPLSLIPVIPAPVIVTHVSGKVYMNEMPLSAGMAIAEGATVKTGPDGSVTARLVDGSRFNMPHDGAFRMERARQFQGASLIDSILHVEAGEVDTEVAPKGEGVGRFEIRTPIAITGVRGTRYRLRAADQGMHSEVLHGRVDMSAQRADGDAAVVSVSAGQGAVMDAKGDIQLHALPAAPTIGPLQQVGSGQWLAHVTPAPGVIAYRVNVSRDPQGLEVTASHQFETSEIRFSARRPGLHYASVRAISAQGVGGHDTVVSFDGVATLRSDSGQAVMLSSGEMVTLHSYY